MWDSGHTFRGLPATGPHRHCRVKSGLTAIQLHRRAWVDSLRHRLGLGHKRCTGPVSLLYSVISFYRCRSSPAVKIFWKRFWSGYCQSPSLPLVMKCEFWHFWSFNRNILKSAVKIYTRFVWNYVFFTAKKEQCKYVNIKHSYHSPLTRILF